MGQICEITRGKSVLNGERKQLKILHYLTPDDLEDYFRNASVYT